MNVISQSIGNVETGPYYWVGHCANNVDYYIGQTFKTKQSGLLKQISLFPALVYGNTEAKLTVFEFDELTHEWQEQKAEVKASVTKAMEGQWITFKLDNVKVDANKQYAFKLSCNSGGMLAVAENPWHTANPYNEGEEWIGSSENPVGNFHKDFDVAFKADIEN